MNIADGVYSLAGINYMTPEHKATNDNHRQNFDRIFPNAYVYLKFRKPIAPPTKAFRDKSKYNRKKKYGERYGEER